MEHVGSSTKRSDDAQAKKWKKEKSQILQKQNEQNKAKMKREQNIDAKTEKKKRKKNNK
jgi:hypothetical protein